MWLQVNLASDSSDDDDDEEEEEEEQEEEETIDLSASVSHYLQRDVSSLPSQHNTAVRPITT